MEKEYVFPEIFDLSAPWDFPERSREQSKIDLCNKLLKIAKEIQGEDLAPHLVDAIFDKKEWCYFLRFRFETNIPKPERSDVTASESMSEPIAEKDLYCLAQHFRAFRHQAFYEKAADWAETCENCRLFPECRCKWGGVADVLEKQFGILLCDHPAVKKDFVEVDPLVDVPTQSSGPLVIECKKAAPEPQDQEQLNERELYCLARRFQFFRHQAVSEAYADWTSPCKECPLCQECGFDWDSVERKINKKFGMFMSRCPVRKKFSPK